MNKIKRRTQILATAGPSMQSLEQIIEAIKGGANNFRLHLGSRERDNTQYFKNIRLAEKHLNKDIGVLIDFPAARPRTKEIEPIELKSGKKILFINDFKIKDVNYVPLIGLEKYIKNLKSGERILFRGGKIVFKITKISIENNFIEAECVFASKSLKKNCVSTFPDSSIVYEPYDLDDMQILQKFKEADLTPNWLALSFASSSEQLNKFKELNNMYWPGKKIGIIAKIENNYAIENIDEIIEASDGIMVARSDLSLHLPPKKLPNIQRTLTRKAQERGKLNIIASHFLNSYSKTGIINRSELSDVALGVRQNANMLMLSGESGNSSYPLESITLMNKIINEESNELIF